MRAPAKLYIIRPSCSTSWTHGHTLPEILVAMVLAMLIILAVTGLIVSAKSAEAMNSALMELDDNARFALFNIANSVQQAGYPGASGEISNPDFSPAITGLDGRTLKANSPDLSAPLPSQNLFSDILAIRFAGAGQPPDNTVFNCAGVSVGAGSPGTQRDSRSWSIYYVANDVRGDPNLYCKYQNNQFSAQVIASGVEDFQVLYRIDRAGAEQATTSEFLNASAITAMDAGLPASSRLQHSHWRDVTAVKIALLMRGRQPQSGIENTFLFQLFGPAYHPGTSDPGTSVTEKDIAPLSRAYLRRVYRLTIPVRNH